MTRIRTSALFIASLAALLFVGCPTDGRRDTFEYLRSPVTFRMDPVAADHPYCLSDSTRLPGTTEEQCRAASKYRLRWDRPEDTVGFEAYRIYVDTTPPTSPLPWSNVRRDGSLASFILAGPATSADSIIFILSGTGSDPTLERTAPRIVALDTTGRLDSSGRLVFAIVTSYRGGGLEGQPRYTWVITDDRFAPYPLQPRYTAKARSVEIEWARPGDPTSFFEPGADSGIVLAYFLRVIRPGPDYPGRPGVFNPTITYFVGGVDRTAEVDSTHFFTGRGWAGRLFRLPDSSRVRNRNAADPLDSLRVTVTGLSPQDTVEFGLWAVDAAKNVSLVDSGAYDTQILTDTTQPTTPRLSILDSSRNGFVYTFTASRDLVPSGTALVPAAEPNANILEYRVTRRRVGGPAAGAASFDTVITVRAEQRGDTLFTVAVRYLAPGASYRLLVRAVDSSGHASGVDSADVSTPSAGFSGPDSGATCPPGFVAIPGGSFMFGDSSASRLDEKPYVSRVIEPYCIEAYEHRDSNEAFVVRKTWQQAYDICGDLSESMIPGTDSTWLCTEAEWERACEGGTPDVPLIYGLQSEQERSDASKRFACNIGTNDSAMALSTALRDPSCISYEGAFDLSGNLAEWVMDPLTLRRGLSDTVNPYPATPETLSRGVPHTPVATASAVRAFRGSHYLNSNQSPSVLLSRARCSNRDYATQSRPQPLAGCIDPDRPQIVVTYNSGKPTRCLPLPDTLTSAQIDTITPARDSSQLLILLKGVAQPLVYRMPFDTVYNMAGVRPIDTRRSRQTLAIVTFRNSETGQTILDTLPASELLGASQATLDAIFRREASPPWSVVKVNNVYDITFLYAHAQTRNVPAKAYHSNAALGFRCCSKPRPGN